MHPDIITNHGTWFLIGLALFPRITLMVSSVLSGGLLWWLGWIFAPHLLVAFLSIPFWHSNPVLVIIAWIMAFTGTSAESHTGVHITRRQVR